VGGYHDGEEITRMTPAALAALISAFVGAPVPAGEEAFVLRDGVLELTAALEPLTDTAHGLEQRKPEVLVKAPFQVLARYDVDHFRRFLPPEPVELGDVWPLEATAVLPFLRQLMPGASAELHHGAVGAPGAFACLRSVDEREAEIVLRAHAEFRFHAGGLGTEVWYTPAQFRGRLRLDRVNGRVSAFELLVPDARANLDLNVRVDDHVEADIGRIPRLELRSGPFPADLPGGLTLAEAEVRLAQRFYPATTLEWLALPAALARAQETGKPLHVLVMFGSLFDESC